MAHSIQSLFLIKCRQAVIQIKRIAPFLRQAFHRAAELPAVVIDLDHLFHTLETDHLFIGKPVGSKHLIRRLALAEQTVFLLHFFHIGTLQHLQKAELKLFRLHFVYIVEGTMKALDILIRKPRNQVEMLMDVAKGVDLRHTARHLVQIHRPPDLLHNHQVRRLHADFQLNQPRTHLFHQCQLVIIQKIR